MIKSVGKKKSFCKEFIMADNKDMQAAFMEALNGLKEYAKVNGNIVTKEDVNSYFKDMHLDDNKYSMITGYLMANGITIKGEDGTDNEFLHMLESTADDSVKNDENGIVIDDNADVQGVDDNQGNNSISEDNKNHINSESNNDGLITKINISEEEVKSLPEKEAAMAAQMIADNMDYSEDDVYLERYKKELEAIQPVSDTTRAYLLINIVEDNDKESLKILSESYLEKIVEWVEPYRCRGVLAADLSLYISDYRASERTFQLLTQAAGRAGRGDIPGNVIIQTYDPDHYSITTAKEQNYEAFYGQEIEYRKMMRYPPVWNMLYILCASKNEAAASEAAVALMGKIDQIVRENSEKIFSIGPSDAPVAKISDVYRKVIYVKTREHQTLVILKDGLEAFIKDNRLYQNVAVGFDFNPVNGF